MDMPRLIYTQHGHKLNFSVISSSARNLEPVKISRATFHDKSADYASAEYKRLINRVAPLT